MGIRNDSTTAEAEGSPRLLLLLKSGAARLWRLPVAVRIGLLVLLLLALWYGVGGALRAGIHMDLASRPGPELLAPGGSVLVGQAARLIEEQVDDRAFTPNDSLFLPTAFANRTKMFQAAVLQTTTSVATALSERAERPLLQVAAAELATPPRQGWLRSGWPPVGLPAERHYRRALTALAADNRSRAVRPPAEQYQPATADVLRALLGRINAEVALGDRMIRQVDQGSLAQRIASARGTAYAAAVLLRGLREDNALAIRQSGKAARWSVALDSLSTAATHDPLIHRQSDLVTIGYSMLLAGNAIQDILEDG